MGAARLLGELLKGESIMAPEIAEFLSNVGYTWYFIPPKIARHGGLWEQVYSRKQYKEYAAVQPRLL